MSVSRLHHYEFGGERCQAHSSLVEICHMAHPTKKARKGVMKLVFLHCLSSLAYREVNASF